MKIEVENAQQNEQVDWTKNPQLVESIVTNEVYLVLEVNDYYFNGINVMNFRAVTKDIKEENYKPFHGKITLSND
jgi:hypothetical protein